MKGLTMASGLAITIPKTTKVKILQSVKRKLNEDGYAISSGELLVKFNQAELIEELIVNEMIGSKNKYLIDLMKELGDNKD